jgi:hypothetical protein
MKYRLLGDWPVDGGAMIVPEGTLIEWEADAEAARLAGLPNAPLWLGQTLPLPMPANAMAMDQQSYDAQVAAYARAGSIELLISQLRPGPGVTPKRFVNGQLV